MMQTRASRVAFSSSPGVLHVAWPVKPSFCQSCLKAPVWPCSQSSQTWISSWTRTASTSTLSAISGLMKTLFTLSSAAPEIQVQPIEPLRARFVHPVLTLIASGSSALCSANMGRKCSIAVISHASRVVNSASLIRVSLMIAPWGSRRAFPCLVVLRYHGSAFTRKPPQQDLSEQHETPGGTAPGVSGSTLQRGAAVDAYGLLRVARAPALQADHHYGFSILPHATQYAPPGGFGAPQCEQYTGPGVLAVRSSSFQPTHAASTGGGTGRASRGSSSGRSSTATAKGAYAPPHRFAQLPAAVRGPPQRGHMVIPPLLRASGAIGRWSGEYTRRRSEEHTSELQSH